MKSNMNNIVSLPFIERSNDDPPTSITLHLLSREIVVESSRGMDWNIMDGLNYGSRGGV